MSMQSWTNSGRAKHLGGAAQILKESRLVRQNRGLTLCAAQIGLHRTQTVAKNKTEDPCGTLGPADQSQKG